MKKLYLFLFLLAFGITSLQAASVTFKVIYKGTGTAYDLQTNSVPVTTAVIGSNFKFTSANPADVQFSGNNVAGQLSYITSNGAVYINGVISRRIVSSGSNVVAFYFAETTLLGGSTVTGQAWVLPMPPTTYTNETVGTNSAGFLTDLNSFLTTQSSNDAPIITSNGGGTTAAISINEGTTAITTVTSSDADAGDTKTFSISGGVDAAKFTINATTGVLTISAVDYENPTDAGKDNTYEVQVTVTDSQGATDVQTIVVTVLDVNDNAPVITSNGGGSTATVQVTAGTKPVTDVNATDADLDVLTYSISNPMKYGTFSSTTTNPNYSEENCDLNPSPTYCNTTITTYISEYRSVTNPFIIDSNTGLLTFINNATTGDYKITVTASDGTYSDTQTLTINVTSTDTQAPSVVISSADNKLSAGEVTTVYFQFSEQVQGFTSADVTIAGGTLGTIYQDAQDPTKYYASFTQTGTSDPSVTVAASSYQDLAGNNGTIGNYNGTTNPSFTKDLTAPGVTVEISATDIAYGSTRTVTFTFTEDPGTSFNINDITVTGGTLSGLIQDAVDPKIWTATLQSTSSSAGPVITVPSGSYTDIAGNSGTSGTDSAILAPPAIDLANNSTSDTGESSTDNITTNRKPVIEGMALSDALTVTVAITNGATTYNYTVNTTLVDTKRYWTLDLSTATASSGTSVKDANSSAGLLAGTIGLQVTSGSAIASSSFVIDLTAPTAPTVTSLSSSDATPTLTGTATVADGEKLTVVVNGVTYTQGDGNLSINTSNNTWSLNIPGNNALTPATYTVLAKVTDAAGNNTSDATSNELTITVKATTADGTWNTGGNWQGSSAPSASTAVEVGHNINVPSGATTTNNIIIKSTGKITNQGNLTIDGDIIFEVDNASVSSQFLNSSTTTLNGKIKIRKTFTPNKWYYMSFPFDVHENQIFVAGTTTQATWGDLTGDAQFYVAEYDGAERASEGTASTTSSSHWKNVSPRVLKARHGYFIALDATAAFTSIDFVSVAGNSAPLNNTSTASEVYKNSGAHGDVHNNWNLVGLPYVSSFNLQNAGNFAPYYFFNQTTQNFATVMEGDSYSIYPFTAFYLQAYGTDNAMDFGSAGRVLKAPAMSQVVMDELFLELKNDQYSDVSRIRLSEEGTNEYQVGKDAVKMLSPVSAVPQLYSVTDGNAYSVNTLPYNTNTINFKTRIGVAGKYNIQLTNAETLNKYSIILKDNQTGSQFDLTSGDIYSFDATTGTSDRFTINISMKVATNTISTNLNENIRITSDRKIELSNLKGEGTISVFDIYGRLITNETITQSIHSIQISNAGAYLIQIKSSEFNSSSKILIY